MIGSLVLKFPVLPVNLVNSKPVNSKPVNSKSVNSKLMNSKPVHSVNPKPVNQFYKDLTYYDVGLLGKL